MIKWNVWTTEYQGTHKDCSAFGVKEAMNPTPPEGNGWKLEAASISDNSIHYWWKRIRWTPISINRPQPTAALKAGGMA